MTFEYEQQLYDCGFKAVCGVDEAGRGPLCGPVCAAAVILPLGVQPEGLNDSKKLSEKKRERLYDEIIASALAYNICMVDAKTVDEINILQAALLAMRGAVQGLKIRPDAAIIDGNQKPGLDIEQRTVVKGDSKCPSVAAASILAKVARDRYMLELDGRYPQYGFAAHKGYGTKAHYQAIERYGICPEHRLTFLRKFYEKAARG